MTIKWQVWLLLAAVIVAALALWGYSEIAFEPPTGTGEETSVLPPEKLPPVAQTAPATGNIDDTVNAILEEALDAQSMFAAEGQDEALLLTDDLEISDFGQSYNEKEF